MQRMTILGLGKKQLQIAYRLYLTLPFATVREDKGKLIVETDISDEDKKYITEQYNKTGNIVLFEEI